MSGTKKVSRPAHVQHFINLHVHDARFVSCTSSIPVSVILAQSGLETGWGRYVKDGCYFGIKGKSPNNKSVTFTTHEDTSNGRLAIKDTFRAYSSFLDAAKDYANVIRKNYAAALVHKNDPLKFIEHLKRYATLPTYTKTLKAIIIDQNLEVYDNKTCKGVGK